MSEGQAALPVGWSWATLSELVGVDGLLSDGDWVETRDQDPDGDVRLIQLADVGDGAYRDRSSRFLTGVRASELGCTFLREGDVLISRMADPIGRACLFPGDPKPCVAAVDICIVRPGSDGVDPRWLMRAVNAPQFRRQIERAASGTTRKRISRSRLSELLVPVPPLAEQRRIVGKLDEALARSLVARAALDAVPLMLEQHRQAVLASAFRDLLRGKSPRYMLESLLIQGRWITYGVVQTGAPTTDGVPTVRCGDIKRFAVAVDALKRVAPQIEAQYPRTRLRGGEVLMAIRGTVGEVAVASPALAGANVSREVALIPVHSGVDPEYLMFLLASPVIAATINRQVKGVAQSGINIGDLRRIEIPLPSRARQSDVVRTIRDTLARIERLVDCIMSSRSDLKVLQQTTLAKAFRGELVPQDSADEPASVLLERIRAERPERPVRRSRHRPART